MYAFLYVFYMFNIPLETVSGLWRLVFAWFMATFFFGTSRAEQTGHYIDVIMSAMASQITSVSIACSTVSLGAHQRKHQSSASLAFVRGIHRLPVDFPHKGQVTRKMFPFDVIMAAILQPTFSNVFNF